MFFSGSQIQLQIIGMSENQAKEIKYQKTFVVQRAETSEHQNYKPRTDTSDLILPFDLEPIKSAEIDLGQGQQQENGNKTDKANYSSKKECLEKVNSIILRIKIQSMAKYWMKRTKKSRHRMMVLKEWVATERSYINDLTTITEKIQKPLLKAKLITIEQDMILFPNLGVIKKLSEELLQQLELFIKDWHPITTKIGNKMIYFHKFFKIYQLYCNNFYKGLAIVKRFRKRPESHEIESKLPMDYESYLIKPVQRPPKYQLLLREYQKVIPKTHLDYVDLTDAISKYRQVNEENNKSMDEQMNTQKLISLQQKHGNILKNTRFYISQQLGYILQHNVKIYLFNDMVMVVTGKGKPGMEDQYDCEEIFKKIYLDGKSFVELMMDCKYFLNRLFLCGKKENIHLHFGSKAERDTLFQTLNRIIMELYDKQLERKSLLAEVETRKRTFTRVKVTLNQDKLTDIIYLTNLRITVSGVEKRPISAVRTETFYIVKVQTPFPDNIIQYTFTHWDELVDLEHYLLQNNRFMYLPVLDAKPDSMNYYDIKKNKSKIIEFRSIHLERFLNFLVRSEEIMRNAEDIRSRLRINPWLWKFATSNSEDRECLCKFCIKMRVIKNMSDFLKYRASIHAHVRELRISKTFTVQSQNLLREKKKEKTLTEFAGCVFWTFRTMQIVRKLPSKQFNTLQERLIWMDYNQGRVDYSLIRTPPMQRVMKINIFLASIDTQEQYLQIQIDEQTLVYDILQDIGQKLGMKTMRDYALFLDYYDTSRLLDQDQSAQDMLKLIDSSIQIDKFQPDNKQHLGFLNRVGRNMSAFKKAVQQLVSGRKSRIILRKYISLEPEVEMMACICNPVRAQLVVKEMFYQFKNQLLILSYRNSISLVALYYIIMETDQLVFLNQTNFKTSLLNNILPDAKTAFNVVNTLGHLGNSSHKPSFYSEVFQQVMKVREDLQPSRKNVQKIYNKILQLIVPSLHWSTLWFEVSNYQPSSLIGNSVELLAGINYKDFIIIRRKELVPLLVIPLVELQYKVTPFSLFIITDQREYRFDGRIMYGIKKMIEAFREYSIKFGQQTAKSFLKSS